MGKISNNFRHILEAFPSQERFLTSRAQFKGFSGPIGTGKTMALCFEALRAAQRNPGCTGFLGGPTYAHLYDVAIPTLVNILEEHRIPFDFWQGARPRIYLRRLKVLILFRSTEKPDRLRGLNLAWFGLDEMTYCRPEAWEVLCQRIRQPQAQWVEGFGVWTPKGYDWVYRKFISPKSKLGGYEAILAAPNENVAMLEAHPDYYEQLKRQYDERFYRQEVLGEYLNMFAGACYPAFNESRNEKPTMYEPNLGGLAWTLDFNIDPMASLICQAKGRERLEVLQEITLHIGTVEGMCERFVQIAQPYLQAWRSARGGMPLPVTVYGDASGHARSLVGKTTWAVLQEFFRDRGRDFKIILNANVSNPPVVDRVVTTNAMLCNAAGQARCLIDPSCRELITDLYETAWMKDDQTQIDKKSNRKRTHWSDALGYLLYRDYQLDAFRRVITPAHGLPYSAG